MVPRAAVQVTAVFVVVPSTVAENGSVLPTIAEAVDGEIVIELTNGGAGELFPWSEMTTGVVLALLMKLRVPLTVPEVVGSNITLNFWLCPGDKANGGVSPDVLKPVPAIVT
jgi:hypothetical protein